MLQLGRLLETSSWIWWFERSRTSSIGHCYHFIKHWYRYRPPSCQRFPFPSIYVLLSYQSDQGLALGNSMKKKTIITTALVAFTGVLVLQQGPTSGREMIPQGQHGGCPTGALHAGAGYCKGQIGMQYVPQGKHGSCPHGLMHAGAGYCRGTVGTKYVLQGHNGSCPSGFLHAGAGYCRSNNWSTISPPSSFGISLLFEWDPSLISKRLVSKEISTTLTRMRPTDNYI